MPSLKEGKSFCFKTGKINWAFKQDFRVYDCKLGAIMSNSWEGTILEIQLMTMRLKSDDLKFRVLPCGLPQPRLLFVLLLPNRNHTSMLFPCETSIRKIS